MRTFLIDLENVKNQGMLGIESLAAEDRVFIFYSESANSLSIPTIQAMNNSKAQIDYVHLQRSGRNAMDFQIVALLGFLIGSERTGQFCIVSQDNGYLAPVEFFMDHAADQLDVHVLQAASIQRAVRKWNSMPQEEAKAVEPVEELPVIEIEVQEEEQVAEEEETTKRRGRPRKESSAAKPKKKSAEYKQVEVPQELIERIHEILNGHLEEDQVKYEKNIAQALLSTKAKNEFYQYFRRTLGVQAGGDLYRVVRGDYEKLKAACIVKSEEAE